MLFGLFNWLYIVYVKPAWDFAVIKIYLTIHNTTSTPSCNNTATFWGSFRFIAKTGCDDKSVFWIEILFIAHSNSGVTECHPSEHRSSIIQMPCWYWQRSQNLLVGAAVQPSNCQLNVTFPCFVRLFIFCLVLFTGPGFTGGQNISQWRELLRSMLWLFPQSSHGLG